MLPRRYNVLPTLGGKKQCFNEYRQQRKLEEIEETKQRLRQAKDAFLGMLEASDAITSEASFRRAKELFEQEAWWKVRRGTVMLPLSAMSGSRGASCSASCGPQFRTEIAPHGLLVAVLLGCSPGSAASLVRCVSGAARRSWPDRSSLCVRPQAVPEADRTALYAEHLKEREKQEREQQRKESRERRAAVKSLITALPDLDCTATWRKVSSGAARGTLIAYICLSSC